MRSLAIFATVIAVALCADAPFIWPLPKEYKLGDKTVTVDAYHFRFSTPAQSNELISAFQRYYDLIFDRKSEIVAEGVRNVRVTVEVDKAELQLGVDESYTLEIPEDGSDILITAPNAFGAMHGLETLSQLIVFDSETLTYVIKNAPWVINDAPRFPHRGILMDTARHFESLPSIKKLIDSMTYAKLNTLHWHISDSQSIPAQSLSFPKWWEGSYTPMERYSVMDIEEIVEYARMRGIRVVPEMDVPGHEASWCTGYPEVCPSESCLEPLDPTSEQTWALIQGVLDEWSGKEQGKGIFFDNYIHMGGDEVDTSCWKNTQHIIDWMKANNFTDHDTYKYFVEKVHKIVMDNQRNGIFWEEVWLNFGTNLDKNTIIQTWLNKQTMKDIVSHGYRVIISDPHTYLDHLDETWKALYNDEPFEFTDDPEEQKLVLGGEACMWAETVDVSDLYNTVWPRAGAFAERYWSPREVNDVEAAHDRIRHFRCLLNRRGIPAAPVDNARGRSAPPNPGSCYYQ